jgi:catechol 2,3-dioxygenase-like lactoylglutathione lyase family enzyme
MQARRETVLALVSTPEPVVDRISQLTIEIRHALDQHRDGPTLRSLFVDPINTLPCKPQSGCHANRGRSTVPCWLCNSSLARVFDHVGIAVSDLAASERFYRTVLSVLGVEPSHADAELVEWEDWDIAATDREHPVTRGLHVGFRARDRAQVDASWQAGVDAGYRDDGAPGPRTQYGPTYYGGFLLDPDGNSVEAVHGDRESPVPPGRIDHLWMRVRDPEASKRFYTTIAPHAGLRLAHDDPGRVQLSGPDYSFSLVRDERPLTEHVHLAFPAREDATVRAFHAAAHAAGYADHGAPGERAVYHPGYYGAFVLDPDGNNIEVVNHNRG